ncbi:TMV resistance protein N-like [Neltuma alba]|uniref:TMV resistance protein N-like n=1 Tax=Neltuma alba TaxID=207710 RepID=UPI0010A366C5|nr:TMV resistance protein N-like [Prosopis alba]
MAILVEAPSSFSSPTKTKYEYDVFLSFRGEDTRHTFTGLLYDALRRKGINAFIDDRKLGKGEEISPALLEAIERSRISIVVFSRNYATSTWCLEELAHIIGCKEEKKQVVMPVFYKVDPLDVQYQRNSFEKAMAALKDRFKDDLDKVRRWRSALYEAASLSSAWLFDDGCKLGFIERIVEDAYARLPPNPLHSVDHPVGLKSRIEEVKSLLDQSHDGVCMLGIHGTGGIGKTTLAKALYNSIFCQFEGASFLLDVREASNEYRGIVRLQQLLLSEILEEKSKKFGSVDEGITKIKHRLSHKRVLLVLDDVDALEQLEQLAGGCNWFGSGSKIIITTRDKQLLSVHGVQKTYEMKELNEHESLELFSWHAFHNNQPPKGYEDMSGRVISYAQGLPLALRVIGSNLTQKSLEEWKSILERYDRIPDKTIHEVLKISYDCLQDNAKSIFLDVACFFKKWRSVYADEVLHNCHGGARFYFEVLIDKSLVSVDKHDCLWMHDLIQEMGREIVRQEAPLNPGERSRLWHHEDVVRVLRENSGSSKIEGIMLKSPQQEEVAWSGFAFEKMSNLRILIVRNALFSTGPKHFPNNLRLLDWEGYPSMSLPVDFYLENIVVLRLCRSYVRLVEPIKRLEYVTSMDFSYCEFITEVPNMSQVPNLKELIFVDCRNLIKVHNSVGYLSKLAVLTVNGCRKLKSFPREIKLASLEHLDLAFCESLDYFPNIVGKMDALSTIFADNTAIEELPHSIGNLSGLQILSLNSCEGLREIPDTIFTLQNLVWLLLENSRPHSRKSLKKSMQDSYPIIRSTNLKILNLENCCLLDEDLHLTVNCFRNLQELNLSGNDILSLPDCIKECAYLEKLNLDNCKRLRDIPELPPNLADIQADNCISLTRESLSHLWSQARKEVYYLAISSMPASTFPDWLNFCCKGGTLSFRVRGNFPVVALVFEFEKGGASHVSEGRVLGRMSINGHEVKEGNNIAFPSREGHVGVFDLRRAFPDGKHWKILDGFLELDWNDVEIEAKCEPPDLCIVKCGVYVYQQQTDMENVQFKSSLLSSNDPKSSLKRRAIASPPDERTKKFRVY